VPLVNVVFGEPVLERHPGYLHDVGRSHFVKRFSGQKAAATL
jgi:hypothetical protein